jgi:hypothetical protein
METDQAARKATMARLEPFIGEWTLEAVFAQGRPPGDTARCVFEWILDGQFVLQRATVPHPDAPDGFSVIGVDAETGAYTQHYFDSRGVARLYSMTFDDGVWKLLRESPDFTPLDFLQRFTGTFEGDDVVRGAWEICRDGSTWELDFDLIYTRDQ